MKQIKGIMTTDDTTSRRHKNDDANTTLNSSQKASRKGKTKRSETIIQRELQGVLNKPRLVQQHRDVKYGLTSVHQ